MGCVLEQEPLVKLARDGQLQRLSSIAASGPAWTPSATANIWTRSGTPARPPGAAGLRKGKVSMRVFVTGHKGYIGVHLTDILKAAGHHVTGCDLNLFEGCAWDKIVSR